MKKIASQTLIFGFLGMLFAMCIPAEVWAQLTDTTNAGMRGAPRIYKIGARTSALGDATVAEPHDVSVVNINPAGISFIRDTYVTQVNISQNWNNNLMLENITFPVFRLNQHSFTAQAAFHHGGIKKTNFLGTNPMPEPDMAMYQMDLAYAISFENSFSLGILSNFTYAKNDIARYMTSYQMLGLMYSPTPSVSYGVALRGLGRSVTYSLLSDSTTTTLGSQSLRESLEMGATLQFPVDTDNTYLSLSLANEKQFGIDGIWYKLGVELKPIPFVELRSGLLFHSVTNSYAPRFGLGIVSDVLELDFTVSHSQEFFERFHQLGITIHLDKF